MAKKRERDLFGTLRASGVRKSVARAMTESTRQKGKRKQSTLAEKTIANLRVAITELDRRARATSRSEAAKKGARTRKRKAAARSSAARKGAKTRARKKS